MNSMLGMKSIDRRKSVENIDEHGIYCAELVGAAYRELGILSPTLEAHKLTPG